MITSFSKFIVSSLPVHDNAVKNIIFHAATIMLQISITKFFAFLALRSNYYTSYLMFSENIIKKAVFAASRKFRPQALLVLLFAIAFSASNLYDTLLWALDSPGYIIHSSTVTAEDASNNMLTSPSYINFISNPTRNLDDINVDESLTGNLYKSGFNFTFPEIIPSSNKPAFTSSQPFELAGPRIWLDEEGLSVSVDQFQSITTQVYCPTVVSGAALVWKCVFPNHNGSEMLTQLYGQPLIWWDNETDSKYLSMSRKDNPWQSLGTGGDTAVMKQVFTVTKGNSRHTFLETVVKVTMVSINPPRLDDGEITELIRRTWSPDPTQPIDNATQSLADFIVGAQANGTSASLGSYIGLADNASVFAASIELLHPTQTVTVNDDPLYALLRISSTNITYIGSETLPESVQPLEPCNYYYENLAFGGKVTKTDCYRSLQANQTGARFLGQLDSSAITILTDIIGDGSQATNDGALNATGWLWYTDNQDRIDSLLLSRGITLGGNPTTVSIEVKTTVPAISYLQVLLVVLPLILAIIALLTMMKDHGGYYSSSFLSALSATTHISSDSCTKLPFASAPPDIRLKYVGQHVVLQTGNGDTVTLVNSGELSPYLVSSEPLLSDNKEV
ncbi:hypothetical protein BDQ17DRAFT_151393 [Cyathus striatus]|nr:hypothetical protein BDQ17DRAFT_151393 [Cyathus striatus]